MPGLLVVTTWLVATFENPGSSDPGFSMSGSSIFGSPLPKRLRKPGAREDDTDS
jgi:hypothetical protein